MKKTLEIIAGVMLLISIASMAFAQTYVPITGAGRVFLSPNLPTTVPSKFTGVDHLLNIADSTIYQRVNGAWIPSYLKQGKDGKDGKDGLTGPAGPAGPQGPAGSGGSLPTTVGTMRFCYTETDLRNAIAGISNNTVKNIQIVNEIRITGSTPIALPKTLPTVYEDQIEISLNGNTIYDNSPSGLAYLIGMQPVDQTEAMNMANKPRSYRIHGGRLVGKGSATGYLIDLACAQRSVVENMYLENANVGVRMAFCMFSEVRNITSSDIYSILVEPTRGEWPGSGNNLCSSNQFKVSNVRAFVRDGMKAIIWSRACSGHKYELITGEGGYSSYGIYWDYNGANEVKNGPEINLCHWEGKVAAQFSTAFIYIRQGGGSQTVIRQTNHQLFEGTRSPLIYVQGEGGGNTVFVENLSWLISDSKFQSGGQNFWDFKNCYDGANLFSQSRWVGTIPNGQSVYNNGTSVITVKRP